MPKEIKVTKNKAKDVEINPKIEALWAKYGRLQAEREQLAAILQDKILQMRNIQAEIAKLEQTK